MIETTLDRLATASQPAALSTTCRDREARDRYLHAAQPLLPRLLSSIDRNPFHTTYGCFDRQFWHYRTASFPSEMYQEGVLPLALAYVTPWPDNAWYQEPRIRELAIAALRFSARNHHGDGSCDDYYPFERALGAAVFSLQACTRAYQLLQLDDPAILQGLMRRGRWVAEHSESGRLTNHHALAALGLARLGQIAGCGQLLEAAEERVRQVVAWQSAEGWFEEYGGADPGYQTVTIDCLAKFQQMTGARWLDEPLKLAVEFCSAFLHPDGSYAGEYGSRGTYHFYPHGFELLARRNPAAARLADGFLKSLARGTAASFDDDRLYVHRLGNLIEAWIDWSDEGAMEPEPATVERPQARYFRDAELIVVRDGVASRCQTIVSGARGGVFKHFAAGEHVATDAGLIIETTTGQQATTQRHQLPRTTRFVEHRAADGDAPSWQYEVEGMFEYVRHETATPLKQAVFHLGLITVGRWCRTLIRKLLQRRLITTKAACPIRFQRTVQIAPGAPVGARLKVIDCIELVDPGIQIARMAYGSDMQTAYVAASGVYHAHGLLPWTSLGEYVEALNRDRKVTIERSW